MISVEIIGTDGLMIDLKRYGVDAEKAIGRAITRTCAKIEGDAKKKLKSGLQKIGKELKEASRTGFLMSSIRRMKNHENSIMEGVVGTDIEYAPYIEFGTGDYVEIPAGQEDVAAQYKGKGIRKVNIHAVSFLNYAMVTNEKTFVDRLEQELNNLNK